MPKRSTPIKIEKEALAAIADREVPMLELFKELNRAGGTVAPDLNRAIRDKYGSSISISDRDALVDSWENGLLFVNGNGELEIGGNSDDTLKAVAN